MDARSIRRAAGECLKRVDLTRRLRLLGVRAGALARLADLVGTPPASCTPRRPSLPRSRPRSALHTIRYCRNGSGRRRTWQCLPRHDNNAETAMPVITEHRRPARPGQAARAAHVLRLRRFGLVDRGHLPRQRERLPGHQAAPARGGEHGEPQHRDDDGRRRRGDAGRHRAGRPDRHAARRRRDPRRARRREVRHPVHAVDDEHLLDRGRRRGHQGAVLVPALRDARPRLHRAPDRPRQGRATAAR